MAILKQLQVLLRCGRRTMGCRVPYSFYLMCFCGLYLMVIFVFHGRLQLEVTKPQVESHTEHGTKISGSAEKTDSAGSNNKIIRQIQSIKSKPYYKIPKFSNSEPSSCMLPPTTKTYSFVSVVEDIFYVYSAYFDQRYIEPYVRVIALILKGKKNKVAVKCHFNNGVEGGIVNNASIYEMCENHNRRYGGYILSCSVPKEMNTIPCQIGISVIDTEHQKSSESKAVMLNITGMSPRSAKYDFGVCIPPLFGDVSRNNIVEFIELTKLLGAQHFIFYNFNITNQGTNKVLDYYTKQGTVTVIPWKLPESIEDRNIWYHGQLLAHNDCLNRATSLMKVVSINDIDEFIVPHDNNLTWQQSLNGLMQDNVVGLSFNSAFYDPSVQSSTHSSGLFTLSNVARSKMFSRVRTKVMFQPFNVFEVGIHHVSKPAQEGLSIKKVDTKIAYLHHYRKCVSNYGMKCTNFEQDTTIYRYYDKLNNNYNNVLKTVDGL